MRGLLIFL
jgi:hypothetical protein